MRRARLGLGAGRDPVAQPTRGGDHCVAVFDERVGELFGRYREAEAADRASYNDVRRALGTLV